MSHPTSLTAREVAALLAGLRLLQELRRVGGIPAPIRAILTNSGTLQALGDAEIDALAEAINA